MGFRPARPGRRREGDGRGVDRTTRRRSFGPGPGRAGEAMRAIRCGNCGLVVQVPTGGRRLCGCGAWLSADEDVDEGPPVELVEADLAAAERLTAGCRRLLAECGKVIVGQHDVLEQVLLAVLARGHCLLV